MHEGLHFIADGYVIDSEILNSCEYVHHLLIEIVELANMQILLGPQVCYVDLDDSKVEKVDDSGGVTAFCIITTSHISIHTFPLEKRFSFDIFSCKSFDVDKVALFLREKLQVQEWKTQVIERSY